MSLLRSRLVGHSQGLLISSEDAARSSWPWTGLTGPEGSGVSASFLVTHELVRAPWRLLSLLRTHRPNQQVNLTPQPARLEPVAHSQPERCQQGPRVRTHLSWTDFLFNPTWNLNDSKDEITQNSKPVRPRVALVTPGTRTPS